MRRSGGNLRQALRRARKLGCTVSQGKGNEIKISHPRMPTRRVTITATRKDCPRALSTLVGHIERGEW